MFYPKNIWIVCNINEVFGGGKRLYEEECLMVKDMYKNKIEICLLGWVKKEH